MREKLLTSHFDTHPKVQKVRITEKYTYNHRG